MNILFVLLVLSGTQAAAASPAAPASAVLSPEARTVRDFVLYAHRRIAEDLIQRRGPYLDTLLAYFPDCVDRDARLDWLRGLLARSDDTRVFAERIADAFEHARNGNRQQERVCKPSSP